MKRSTRSTEERLAEVEARHSNLEFANRRRRRSWLVGLLIVCGWSAVFSSLCVDHVPGSYGAVALASAFKGLYFILVILYVSSYQIPRIFGTAESPHFHWESASRWTFTALAYAPALVLILWELF